MSVARHHNSKPKLINLMGNTLSSGATDWREGHRLRALEKLKRDEWKQRERERAEALGVTEGAISKGWSRLGMCRGSQGFMLKPAPGASPYSSENSGLPGWPSV